MCDSVRDGFYEFTRLVHDLGADMIDHLIVDGFPEIIADGCALDIGFESYIDEIVTATGLFVGVVSVMGIKGHAFKLDDCHGFRLKWAVAKKAIFSGLDGNGILRIIFAPRINPGKL